MAYHINPTTLRPNICRAKIKCDFADDQGNPPPHYETKEEARAAAEKKAEQEYPDALASLRKILDTPVEGEPATVAETAEMTGETDSAADLRAAMVSFPRYGGPTEQDWAKFGVPSHIEVSDNSDGPKITFDNGIQELTLEIEGDCCSSSSLASTPEFPEGVAIVSMSRRPGDDYDDYGTYIRITHYSFDMADGSLVEFDEVNRSNGYYSSCHNWSTSPTVEEIDQWTASN